MANPFPLTDQHVIAWARLVRATTAILQTVEAALKDADLPPLAWYDLLLELQRAGPEGLRPVSLQAEMLIPQYNMSRLLGRVEAAGLVERHACNADGRGQLVRITGPGREMLRAMWPVYRGALEGAFAAHVDASGAEQIANVLSAGFAATTK